MPSVRNRDASSNTSTPLMVKVTMPHCSTPVSCSTRPGTAASRSRSEVASSRTRAQMASAPSRERLVDRGAEPEPVGHAVLPALEPSGVVARSPGGRRVPTAPRARRGTEARAPTVASGGRRGIRCPAGRAGTCGRWPRGSRTRARRRRPAAGRPPGRRRAGTARPPPASPRPTAAAGFTNPPWVGIHDIATTRTRSSSIVRSASTESCPDSSSGITSTRAPVRAATWRKPITLLAYSARDVRMRSPGVNDDARA